MNNSLKRRLTSALTATIAAALLLAGCASPSYDTETAEDLQTRVLAVTEAVGAGDYPTAGVRLGELTAAADAALDQGQVSTERHASILTAAALVQKDVDAAVAAAAALAAQAEEAEKQRVAAEEAKRQAAEDAAEDARDEDGPEKGKDEDG